MLRRSRLPDDVQGLASTYAAREFFATAFGGHEPVTFSRIFV
jgi:hypothetical protein